MVKINNICCDIESFSSVDLAKCGLYKYVESPDFEILLFGYAVDGGEVKVVDLANGEKIPNEILNVLTDDTVIKWAYNANFERICISRFLFNKCSRYLNPVSWRCSMVWASTLGLPRSLEGVGAVLGLDKQKLTEGKELIRYFCVPCAPTKSNGGRTRNRPSDAPDKWERFKAYNLRDVETEESIRQRLSGFPVSDEIWDEYRIDQEINDRGIAVDAELVRRAIEMDNRSRTELLSAMKELTDLDNPNSVQQMKQWLSLNGLKVDSLGKKEVAEMIKTVPPELQNILTLRQQLAKSSVKKYTAMQNAVCEDGRIRGMFQFYGANRTGRFSGRIVQLQNLRQNHLPDLSQARALVRSGDYDAVKMLYGDVPDTLSQLTRTTLVPKPGRQFIVADFSAIEARVIAWLAGEQWVLDAFKNGSDIYCETASRMFGVTVEKHGLNSELRQKGKQATLSCSYGGSVGALKAMGAIESGMQESELQPLVNSWRNANPNIVRLWWDVDRCVKEAVRYKTKTQLRNLTFECRSGMLFITLPSGRKLAYVKPHIEPNSFGGESVTYEGVGIAKKWERLESYGPKFVENCLSEGTKVLTNRGLIPIENISKHDLIWDGVEWVQHNGSIYQGYKTVINVDGFLMTPNHKILTDKGWIEGGKANRSKWAEVSLPDSYSESSKHFTRKSAVALSMRLRELYYCCIQAFKSKKISCKIVWLYEKLFAIKSKNNSRKKPSSRLWSVAFNEAKMFGFQSSCISQLWRSRNKSMRTLDRKLREFLVRYGEHMERRTGSGSNRQQRKLQPAKLSLDFTTNELSKSKKYNHNRHSFRPNDTYGGFSVKRYKTIYTTLQNETRLAKRITVRETGLSKQVYDIKNCGPRHRFTIWNGERFCIVSNCTQGIARDILCYAMKTLRHSDIVATVHDEIIIEADKNIPLESVCEQMGRTPPWADGLLLRADGYVCDFYKKE